jgi:E3 ubiquitin-protein ligase HUWE1
MSRRFVATIERIGALAPAERTHVVKEELVCAYAGLKVLLHLLQPLVSAKPISESPQTALLLSAGKKEGEPGYFSPNAFLVRMRIEVLPFMSQVWESAWLLEAPLSIIKSVVHIVMELVRAENEEAKEGGPAVPTAVPMVVEPDEARITQITDMGFSRGAARRALIRTRNHVATATELLITQPFLFPAGDDDEDAGNAAAPAVPEPAPEAAPEPAPAEAAPEDAAGAQDVEIPDAPPAKSAEQWLTELKELREPLQSNVGRLALRVVDTHPSLIFEVQTLFIGPQGSKQEPSIRRLVDDIKAFSPAAYDVQEQPMAVRCRLLALSLSHPGCQDVVKNDAKNLMDCLLALLLSKPSTSDTDSPSQPKWLAAHLLVADALLMMGERPRAITLPAEGEPVVAQDLRDATLYPEARSILFDTCMRLIELPSLMPTDLLSCLRILILLTREHRYAIDLVKRGGITNLLACIKQGDAENGLAVKTHVMIILRHVVEDPKSLQNIMRLAFKRYFTNPKTASPDVGTFVRGCGAVALRDPSAFVEATAAVCTLSRPYGAPQSVILKMAAPQSAPEQETTAGVDEKEVEGAMQVDTSVPSHEALEPLVHLLIKELLSSSREVLEEARSKESATPESVAPAANVNASSTQPTGEPVSTDTGAAAPEAPVTKEVDYTYASYVMQALAELLFSYDPCKMAFLAYTEKKRGSTPSKEKPRPAALQYIITDLVNMSSLDPKSNDSSKAPGVLCNWAMSIVVALCVDTSYAQDMKDLSPEVVLVRKTVLDAVARAFKEIPASLGAEARYGRLMALSDLVHRLLTVRPHFTTKKPQEDTPTHLAKLMLEKSYVAMLTNAFNEVDLNYPNIKNLVTTILKPLELLYVGLLPATTLV